MGTLASANEHPCGEQDAGGERSDCRAVVKMVNMVAVTAVTAAACSSRTRDARVGS
jgi:hypothetical protein